MKTTQPIRKAPPAFPMLTSPVTPAPPDRGTRYAFYFLMGVLALGLLYFLLLPFLL